MNELEKTLDGMKNGEVLKLLMAGSGGISNNIKAGPSEKELVEKGYEPVSGNRILWILKDECED